MTDRVKDLSLKNVQKRQFRKDFESINCTSAVVTEMFDIRHQCS